MGPMTELVVASADLANRLFKAGVPFVRHDVQNGHRVFVLDGSPQYRALTQRILSGKSR